MAKSAINVQGLEIRLLTDGVEDFISLTDIARKTNERTDMVIGSWLRNRNTVAFLGVWEQLHNPNFNPIGFDGIERKAGLNNFFLTTKQWVEETNAIGLKAKQGGYGGTYAHRDIAFEFCSWVSPIFKLYLLKEFQRLKELEAEQSRGVLDWSVKRTLAKINYHIHTDAVQTHLIPPKVAASKQAGIVYASEADLLNVALFGVTAKQWQLANPSKKGNIRDHATAEQLLVLANLENLNAHLIKERLAQDERLQKLNEVAIYQMALLSDPKIGGGLKKLPDK